MQMFGVECRSVANYGGADSMRGSMDGRLSSMSSHIPSGMTGLASALQGTTAAVLKLTSAVLALHLVCNAATVTMKGAVCMWPVHQQPDVACACQWF